jgi:DNA replication initiation complex subunit (GINS family)
MLNVSRLREIHRKEMECFELVKLERDFYKSLCALIKQKEIEIKDSSSIVKVKELEQMRQIAYALCEKRKEKLIMRIILAGGQLPDHDGLTEEEMAFAERIIRLYKESVIDFGGGDRRGAKEIEKENEKAMEENRKESEIIGLREEDAKEKQGFKAEEKNEKEQTTRVVVLMEIEPYKGFDGNVYGPFKKGSVVSLPKEEADWLLQNRLAKLVE